MVGKSKAPSLNGISNRAFKLAMKLRPNIFLNTFEKIISPSQWKKQVWCCFPNTIIHLGSRLYIDLFDGYNGKKDGENYLQKTLNSGCNKHGGESGKEPAAF